RSTASRYLPRRIRRLHNHSSLGGSDIGGFDSLHRHYPLGNIYERRMDMIDSRRRMDIIKDYIADIDEYEDILDKIMALLNSKAEIISDVSGYDRGMVFIALQEMIGIVEEYTADEIDNELSGGNK